MGKHKVGDRLFEVVQNTVIDDGDVKLLVREYEVTRAGKTYTLYPTPSLLKSRFTDDDLSSMSSTIEEAINRYQRRLLGRMDSAEATIRSAQQYLKIIVRKEYRILTVDDLRERRDETKKRIAEDSNPND